MKTINLARGYRLRRLDDKNWTLEEWRTPTGTRAKSSEEAWFFTGNYFQDMPSACEFVLHHALLDGDEEAGLKAAVEDMKQISAELKSAVKEA